MRLLLVSLLVLITCTPKEEKPQIVEERPPAATATTPETTTQTEMTETLAAEPLEITIERVDAANPVVIAGRARTFENNVVLRVRDARRKLMKETFTTATGEMGKHSPYRGTVWLTRDPGGRITAEALEYSAKDGSERSLVKEERAFNVELIEATLRVPNKDCTGLVTEKRRVPKSVAMARLLVEMLMDNPVFPKGSAVNSVNLKGGVLTVDFNERLQNVGGSCAAQMIRAAVTETLMQLPTVKRVVITAAGSEKLALQP